MEQPSNRYNQAKKVTVIGALVNALLGSIKIAGGYMWFSHALVADGVHSISDLFTDIMVVFASKYGSQSADESHPYGHQRIETAATLFLSLLLVVAGASIAWDSIDELIYAAHPRPEWYTIPIIILSILANELLFHYTQHIGRKIKSTLIIANAWHHRSDAASSVVVLIGLIGSILGYVFLDMVAALIVGLMIIKMGWDYGWNSVKELIDTAVEPELLSQIEEVIQQVDNVERIHQLRSRYMGNDIFIDVHVLVSSKISVSEGHYIAQQVHHALVDKIDRVEDVIVHIDAEDDELYPPSFNLPSRNTLKIQLLNALEKKYPEILFWNIHYLEGSISLDITCKDTFTQWKELKKELANLDKLNEIHLFAMK